MLEIDGLTVAYGGNTALNDVSLSVKQGTIACLLGSNGAGKSTLMNTIAGLQTPRNGRILVDGSDIARWTPRQRVRHGVALVPEGRQLFGDLTIEENIRLGSYTRRGPLDDELQNIYHMFPRLAERRRQLCKSLSGGEQQMVAIGRALMAKPRLLLLDEPSLGLAPVLIRDVMQLVREINAQGITVFLVEQNAHLALRISDHAFVLEKGRIIKSVPAKDLMQDDDLTAAYLGTS
ncbi:ABC transporter ATP-binding protein [Roseovarius nanhaiticus]|uniref:ABC transporter ATP-binding protein n=1 Tax=Roseovarius nanhaiticus TaxID=573024 RepID=UPI002491B6CD|nr:ABC transporter ATP-binding protein [Roseovarius nanhaiticus]